MRQPITVVDIPVQPTETEIIETAPEVYAEYEEPIAKDYWLVWALVIFVVSVLLILFRYG